MARAASDTSQGWYLRWMARRWSGRTLDPAIAFEMTSSMGAVCLKMKRDADSLKGRGGGITELRPNDMRLSFLSQCNVSEASNWRR